MFEYLAGALNAISYLLTKDYECFASFFPHSHWYLYFVIRLFPWLLLLVLLLLQFLKGYTSKVEQFFEFLSGKLPSSLFQFFLIFLAAFAVRLWFAETLPLMVDEGDAMSRMEMAIDWHHNTQNLPGGLIWLPLHFVLLALPSFCGFQAIKGGMAVTLLFGLATFPVLYLLIRKQFDSRVALLSCLILAFNPFHIKFSVLTMTEVPFLFFSLSAFFLTYRYSDTGGWGNLASAAFCLNAASLIRFEGWILSALLPLVLLYNNKKIVPFLLFGVLNSAAIIWYMCYSYLHTGHLIHGLTMSDTEVRYAYEAIDRKLNHIVNGLWWDEVYPFWLLPFWALGVWMGVSRRKEMPLIFIGSFLIAFVSWKIFRLQSEPAWRYLSTGLFFLLPFLAWYLLEITSFSMLRRWMLISCIMLGLAAKVGAKYVQIKYYSGTTPEFFETADWLKKQRTTNEKIVYDTDGFTFSAFRMLANLRREDMYYPHYPGMQKFKNYESYSSNVFLRLIRQPEYSWVVIQKKSSTHLLLQKAEVHHETIYCLDSMFSNNEFVIYRVNH